MLGRYRGFFVSVFQSAFNIFEYCIYCSQTSGEFEIGLGRFLLCWKSLMAGVVLLMARVASSIIDGLAQSEAV